MSLLRVATFNIRNGRATEWQHCWYRRRRTLLDAIRLLDADVIGAQEAFWFQHRWLTNRLGDWSAVGVGRDDGLHRGEHNPILARRARVAILDFRTLWFGSDPAHPGERLPDAEFPRLATVAELRDLESEAAFTAVSTHLDSQHPRNRLASATMLRDWLAESTSPTVILGDFNAELDEDALAVLLDAGYQSALEPGAGGTNHDYTGALDGRQIDHILLTPQWKVRGAQVVTTRPGGKLPSDHWPVIADIELT